MGKSTVKEKYDIYSACVQHQFVPAGNGDVTRCKFCGKPKEYTPPRYDDVYFDQLSREFQTEPDLEAMGYCLKCGIRPCDCGNVFGEKKG